MRKVISTLLLLLIALTQVKAQNDTIFNRTIYNADYNLYLTIDFYDSDVNVPGQEFMGEMAGFLGDYEDFRKWFILEAELTTPTTASLQISNDEGSEDLVATLTFLPDGSYKLTQGAGSTMKIARKRKWQKLPKELIFTTVRQPKKQK